MSSRFSLQLWLTIVGLVGLGLTIAMLAITRLSLYEVSSQAFVETYPAPHQVQSGATGTVVSQRLVVGQRVEEDEVLVTLDTAEVRAKLDGLLAEQASLPTRMQSAERERDALDKLIGTSSKTAKAELAEVRAKLRSEEVLRKLASETASRFEAAESGREVVGLETLERRAEARARRSSRNALSAMAKRVQSNKESNRYELEIRLVGAVERVAQLQARANMVESEVEAVRNQINNREVRAPIAGVIGWAADIHAGSVVSVGDDIVTVVPDGRPVVRARFANAALGRLRVGQQAALALDGFPRVQYGTAPLVVRHLTKDATKGTIEALFDFASEDHHLPVSSGISGHVEVEVEKTSPLVLGLRTAGWFVYGGERVSIHQNAPTIDTQQAGARP